MKDLEVLVPTRAFENGKAPGFSLMAITAKSDIFFAFVHGTQVSLRGTFRCAPYEPVPPRMIGFVVANLCTTKAIKPTQRYVCTARSSSCGCRTMQHREPFALPAREIRMQKQNDGRILVASSPFFPLLQDKLQYLPMTFSS